MQIKKMEAYFLQVIQGKRTGILPAILRPLLLLASWLFQIFSACRNWAFDHGWLRRYCPPVPLVISVGNIVAGGTGKTPATLMLAKEFEGCFPIAILSRGYRSKAEHGKQPICLCSRKGPHYPASFCGDEPYLLSQNLPEVRVYVGKNRHKSSIMAVKAGAKLILLDDGMQHRRLSRDLDVIVMDARDLFGQGYFLPRGFLRESAKSLSRAHLIVINHVESKEQFLEAKAQVAAYTKAPVVGASIQVSSIFDFEGGKIDTLLNKKVGVFCGIARPDYFEKTVESLGAKVVCRHHVPDHCDFRAAALEEFARESLRQGAELLLCTEKDRVKFTESLALCLPAAWLQMELKIVEEPDIWNAFINKAKSDVMRRM